MPHFSIMIANLLHQKLLSKYGPIKPASPFSVGAALKTPLMRLEIRWQ